MVFQRSAFILLLAAAATVVTAEALSVGIQSKLERTVVKHHKHVGHKQVSQAVGEEEIVTRYSHHTASNMQTKKETKPVKKHSKKEAVKPVEKPTETPKREDKMDDGSKSGSAALDDKPVGNDEDGVESEDFGLPVGQSVDLTVDGANITLKHFANGSVVMYASGDVTVLDGKDIYLEFDVEDEEMGSASGSGHGSKARGTEVGATDTSLTKELATMSTGNGFKDATPFIMIGSAIGALAAVVAIAAVVVRRTRDNAAAAEPKSVLAEATEAAVEDVEKQELDGNNEDAAAEETQALESANSESEAEIEQDEDKFVNEDTSV